MFLMNEKVQWSQQLKIQLGASINNRTDSTMNRSWKMLYLQYLREFQEHYVLVPAEKAGNNVLIVCRNHYLDVIVTVSGKRVHSAQKLNF